MDIVDLAPVAEWIAVFAGGFFAGAINVVVGAGTLVSFPLSTPLLRVFVAVVGVTTVVFMVATQ